jgi:hypothetical protein
MILVNKPLLDGADAAFKYVGGSAGPEPIADMVSDSVSKGPVRFGLPKGDPNKVDLSGYSDHFPVSCVLEEGPDVMV